jgi:hypothetical protein
VDSENHYAHGMVPECVLTMYFNRSETIPCAKWFPASKLQIFLPFKLHTLNHETTIYSYDKLLDN